VGDELRPDSRLLSRLQASQSKAGGVRFLSVVAGSDNMVVPRRFAIHEREIHVTDLGHVSMLFAPRVLRLVADHLTGPCQRKSELEGSQWAIKRSWT
jgi:hypothetical protein